MTDHMTTCERCGSAVPAGASVCPSCGAPVGASAYETRKVDAGWSEPEIPLPAEPGARTILVPGKRRSSRPPVTDRSRR